MNSIRHEASIPYRAKGKVRCRHGLQEQRCWGLYSSINEFKKVTNRRNVVKYEMTVSGVNFLRQPETHITEP